MNLLLKPRRIPKLSISTFRRKMSSNNENQDVPGYVGGLFGLRSNPLQPLLDLWWPHHANQNAGEEAQTALLSRLSLFTGLTSKPTSQSQHDAMDQLSSHGGATVEDVQVHESLAAHLLETQPPTKATARVEHVPINFDSGLLDGKPSGTINNFINTIIVDRDDDTIPSSEKKNFVMTHGWGAGAGFWYKNLFALSLVPGYRIFALDWLGCGLSSRPTFPNKGDSAELAEKAERFFVESLEEWRKSVKIHKMVLLGHSLGGYLSACYALRYPQHVERLILVSPVGVPNPPEDEVTEDGRIRTQGGKTAAGWIAKIWEANVTPQSIVRAVGPYGLGLVEKYVSRRFYYLDPEESKAFQNYLYHISTLTGSGEFAMGTILKPGAWAQRPLMNKLKDLQMPVSFIYGNEDWMNYRHALTAMRTMTQNPNTRTITIPDAGHHLYMDNIELFNEVTIREMLEARGIKVDYIPTEGIKTWVGPEATEI